MFLKLEPGYQVLHFPLDCFRPLKDWLFPDSWTLGVINPFHPPDIREPDETRLHSVREYRHLKLLGQITYAKVLEILRNQTRSSVKN